MGQSPAAAPERAMAWRSSEVMWVAWIKVQRVSTNLARLPPIDESLHCCVGRKSSPPADSDCSAEFMFP